MSIAALEHIFRAYDIRGRVDSELTPSLVQSIGTAFANESLERGTDEVVVAGDVRLSTEHLKDALTRGLNEGGVNVVDIGTAPTPVLYFAVEHLRTGAGIVITGSHNPPEFNGLKFVLDYVPFAGDDLKALHEKIQTSQLRRGSGTLRKIQQLDTYIERICSEIQLARPFRVGIDCGNGVTGLVAPRLFSELGCEVHSLYADPDGRFPNHHPDPVKADNLKDLIALVRDRGLDLGVAFDGDGDRVGVVSGNGNIVPADFLMAYFACDILKAQPRAPIVFDVKCSSALSASIADLGGQPIMWKTGHTNIKEKIRERNAPLGGEYSGHICFADHWYGFDDAMYTSARLIELLCRSRQDIDEFLGAMPPRCSTQEIEIASTDDQKFEIIEKLQEVGHFPDGHVLAIDGLRVDFDDGWGLIRASNTTPNLTMRFEAANPNALERVQAVFKKELAKVAPELA